MVCLQFLGTQLRRTQLFLTSLHLRTFFWMNRTRHRGRLWQSGGILKFIFFDVDIDIIIDGQVFQNLIVLPQFFQKLISGKVTVLGGKVSVVLLKIFSTIVLLSFVVMVAHLAVIDIFQGFVHIRSDFLLLLVEVGQFVVHLSHWLLQLHLWTCQHIQNVRLS